ncbi:MAG: CpaD family pilus assembly protein [Aquisalinus sp.]|nr:CpaD family pilus assembly protein [Aquisalinus sp.]
MTLNKSIPALLALCLLPACSTVFNGPNEARTYEEEHPIAVEQQTVTLTVPVDATLTELTQIDKARLRAFARTYFTRGHGPITITAPSGGQFDFQGQSMAADLRQELNNLGVDWQLLKGATYRQSGFSEQGEVIISFSNYVATASECGDWSEEIERRFRNIPAKNFGCFAQQNLAAMIADPRDLVEPTALGDSDAARSANVYEKFVQGEPTSSQSDETIDIQASEQ